MNHVLFMSSETRKLTAWLILFYSSSLVSWKRAAELLVEVAAHGENFGNEVHCLLIAAKDDLEPDPACISSSARV